MRDVFILEAARSALGRRAGDLSTLHPAELLGGVMKGTLERARVDPGQIGQVIGGCVTQRGIQSFNITRISWLTAGLPEDIASTTVDSQCGSGQQSVSLAAGLVGAGIEDVAMGTGVEVMTKTWGMGGDAGSPIPPSYPYAFNNQFMGAQMIGEEFGISREDCDRFGLRSQELANQAWDAGHFDAEIVPLEAPVADKEGNLTGEVQMVTRDGGLRSTTLEKLSSLDPVKGNELHTAGTSSQVSDGAAAVIVGSEEGAKRLGLTPRARIVGTTLVGCDPVTMLKGPIPATEKILKQTGLRIDQIDTFEVNEAFASIPLAWQKAVHPSEDRVNPQGGAIALGHPVGCTGSRLITTALHTLERTGGRYGLVTMCCGGGLGTATVIERC